MTIVESALPPPPPIAPILPVSHQVRRHFQFPLLLLLLLLLQLLPLLLLLLLLLLLPLHCYHYHPPHVAASSTEYCYQHHKFFPWFTVS